MCIRDRLSCVHSRKIKVNYHDSATSVLEGVFAKGDRRMGRVIETADHNGAFFDTWEEFFSNRSIAKHAFHASLGIVKVAVHGIDGYVISCLGGDVYKRQVQRCP